MVAMPHTVEDHYISGKSNDLQNHINDILLKLRPNIALETTIFSTNVYRDAYIIFVQKSFRTDNAQLKITSV